MSKFKLKFKQIPCIACLTEDDMRALLDSIEVGLEDEKDIEHILEPVFDSTGNFTGLFTMANGQSINVLPPLGVFPGAPSGSNPGPGWKVEVELTKEYLDQDNDENNWEIFFASRAPVLNVVP